MYYLQSRYYNPIVGRFVNGDEAEFIGFVEQSKNTNIFIYSENEPVLKTDETGHATVRVVGYGLQIELGLGVWSFGVELVWYIISSIRNGRAWYIPYVYVYGAGGLSGDLKSIISKISKNPSLMFNPKKATKYSASICIFAIFGYTGKLNKPKDYKGFSSGVAVTVWHAKTYVAFGQTCFAVGAGVSTSKFSVDSCFARYYLVSDIINGLSNAYNSIAKKGKKLKK